jgi:hypothetical protein
MPGNWLYASLAVCAFAFCLCGQSETGELRLSVTDTAGAGVAAASLQLASESTGIRQAVRTPPGGYFAFRGLPLGMYRLLVSKPGFSPVSELVEIRSAIPLSRIVTLHIGSFRTSLTVTEHDTLLDPNRAGSAQHIGSQELADRTAGLPGRGLLDLVAMQPGWSFEANGILHPRESEYDTQLVIDGFPVYDNRSPAFAPPIATDSVESVKVYTSGIPAEFGQKLGGVIEVNTVRNTSAGFHGTASVENASFDTTGGYFFGQYARGRTTGAVSAEGFSTDHYLDPPTVSSFTDHASDGSVTGSLERDLDEWNRLRISVSRSETWFEVPDDLLQQAAGQRQDRTTAETGFEAHYQHIFSPELLGSAGAMLREVSARLWSNPLATPISAHQDRGFREGYFKGDLSGHDGRHDWKTGVEARFASIREAFGYRIVATAVDGVPVFDPELPAAFEFAGRSPDREQAAYAQDTARFGSVTLNAGIRFDHYALLVDKTAWSPRAAVAWRLPHGGPVLHASYDRVFDTPPFENLLVSAAPDVAALNSTGFYLPVEPSRGNYYEGGLTQSLGRRVRLDASYFRRDIRNFKDDDLLLNTGVSFPITFDRATVRGTEVKLEVPRWGRFGGYVSYANTLGIARFPISGGLFLDDGSTALLNSNDRFPISQDQRNLARAWLRCQIVGRVWTAWSGEFNSGLPIEGDLPPLDFLVAQFGSLVVDRVNLARGRVRPSFTLSASVGVLLWQHEKRTLSLQADAMNLTDRVNVIDFAGLLSGTAVAPPRSFAVRWCIEF